MYSTRIDIHSSNSLIQVPVKGKGVCPKLYVPEVNVHFEAVVYGSNTWLTKSVKICNDSPYLMKYDLVPTARNFSLVKDVFLAKVDLAKTVVSANIDSEETQVESDEISRKKPSLNLSCFSTTPEKSGEVLGRPLSEESSEEKEGQDTDPEAASVSITINFNPSRPQEVYKEKIHVFVANQECPTYLYVYGYCFQYQMYCINDVEVGPFEKEEMCAKAQILELEAETDGCTNHDEAEVEPKTEDGGEQDVAMDGTCYD